MDDGGLTVGTDVYGYGVVSRVGVDWVWLKLGRPSYPGYTLSFLWNNDEWRGFIDRCISPGDEVCFHKATGTQPAPDQPTPPDLDAIRTKIYDLEQAGRLKDAAELRAELKRMKGTVMG